MFEFCTVGMVPCAPKGENGIAPQENSREYHCGFPSKHGFLCFNGFVHASLVEEESCCSIHWIKSSKLTGLERNG